MRRLSKWLAVRISTQPQGCPQCPTSTKIAQLPPVHSDDQVVADISGLATMSQRVDPPAGAEDSFAGGDEKVADSIQGGGR